MELLVDRDPEQTKRGNSSAMGGRGWPHWAQKLAVDDAGLPQWAQILASGAAHCSQNLASMLFSCRQFGHPERCIASAHGVILAGERQETVKRYAEQVQERYGTSVAIRVGLNSGEIVVRIIGNDLHMEYAAVGQTVHLAACMEQVANPGSVLSTAETVQLAEGYVDVRPLPALLVKGLVEPITAYEVIGAGAARTRLQAAARRGLTGFVNRVIEMEQLCSAQQLAETGQAQVAAIVAESGIGKSRLLHEFLHSRHTTGWLVLQSVPPSYGRAISYLPVIELLEQYFRITDNDTTQAIQEKVSSKMSMLDRSLLDALPPILDLLDALESHHPFRYVDSSEHRRKTYEAVVFTRKLRIDTARRREILG
jgi:Adenylate and Guanylate cyclase catalytic domain/AAA ATPase domain